jgi:hypothetical protein
MIGACATVVLRTFLCWLCLLGLIVSAVKVLFCLQLVQLLANFYASLVDIDKSDAAPRYWAVDVLLAGWSDGHVTVS